MLNPRDVLNQININDLVEESGSADLEQQLKGLQSWLYGGGEHWAASELIARYAASPWARGECELFGVSIPRFQGRVYLTKELDSFVDVRRLRLLADNAGNWLSMGDYGHRNVAQLSETLLQGSAIAGGVIRSPSRLGNYHLLEVNLGLAFGEKSAWGLPFLKHMKLGGGMCSQICLLMASLLMWKHARQIDSVADITLRARKLFDPQKRGQLAICGLDVEEMRTSLVDSGLASLMEVCALKGSTNNQSWFPGQYGQLATRLRAYTLSNIPVILLVDLGKMAGLEIPAPKDAIFKTQGSDFPDSFLLGILESHNKDLKDNKGWRQRRHAVLLGGCEMKKPTSENDSAGSMFIVHDPATYPYLKCTTEQLFNARTQIADGSTKSDSQVLVFIPILPEAVKMPLGATDGGKPGLLDIVDLRLRKKVGSGFTSEFRLINIQDSDPDSGHSLSSQLENCVDNLVLRAIRTWATQKDNACLSWCWVEVRYGKGGRVSEVNFWNASEAPQLGVTKPLVSFKGEDTEFQVKHISWTRPRAVLEKQSDVTLGPATPIPNCHWQMALISSFCTGTLAESAAEFERCGIPSGIGVDLYCFMHRVLKDFFDRHLVRGSDESGRWTRFSGKPEFSNPTRFLAFLDPTSQDANRGSEETRSALRDAICVAFPPSKRKILAISTYFPQITSNRKEVDPEAEDVISALTTIGWLAHELCLRGHDIRSLELVAGTRVRGIYPILSSRDEFEYCADLDSADTGLSLFVKRLRKVAEKISSIWNRHCNTLCLNLEVEPGGMYHASNLDSASRLMQLVQAEKFALPVKLNCDTSHFLLCKFDDKDVEAMAKNIGHIHITGSWDRSHAGDIPCDFFSRSKKFTEGVLQRLSTSQALPHSECVSIEVESPLNRDLVRRAVTSSINALQSLPLTP